MGLYLIVLFYSMIIMETKVNLMSNAVNSTLMECEKSFPYYRSILTDMYKRELTFYYANIEMIKL